MLVGCHTPGGCHARRCPQWRPPCTAENERDGIGWEQQEAERSIWFGYCVTVTTAERGRDLSGCRSCNNAIHTMHHHSGWICILHAQTYAMPRTCMCWPHRLQCKTADLSGKPAGRLSWAARRPAKHAVYCLPLERSQGLRVIHQRKQL